MRKFPHMILKQLQESVKKNISQDYTIETRDAMTQEIADRVSGKSKHFITPQVKWS